MDISVANEVQRSKVFSRAIGNSNTQFIMPSTIKYYKRLKPRVTWELQ